MVMVKAAVILNSSFSSLSSSSPWSWRKIGGPGNGVVHIISSSNKPSGLLRFSHHLHSGGGFRVGASLFDPTKDPIIKDALKEPVAFMGGMFAGLLRLDLNEDPLREWIARTAEAAGITDEEVESRGDDQLAESPELIEIE